MKKQNSQDKIKEAKDFFESLKLIGWNLKKNGKLKQGNQSTVLIVEKTGELGVFKYLKNQDKESKERFIIELNILTNPKLQHSNIVKIIEFSKEKSRNTIWYISEKGEDFKDYWRKKKKEFEDNQLELIRIGFDIIINLLDGLCLLHTNSPQIIHRDIKPNNIIIIKKDKPALIDFGIAYAYKKEADRLTDVKSICGNRRFTPEQAMQKMKSVTPWLDLFQISQLISA